MPTKDGRTFKRFSPEAAKAQKAKFDAQPTWVEWMPDDAPEPQLLSHEELLKAVGERGIDITQYTLDHYRRIGVLPRPVRRRYRGVTQAVYPAWYIGAIAHLKQLQAEGKSLEEIKPWMRPWATSTVGWGKSLAEPLAKARAALQALAAAIDDPEITSVRVTFYDNYGVEHFVDDAEVISIAGDTVV